MDLLTSLDAQPFREQVRTWLEENVPREPRPGSGPELREYDVAWQKRQYEAGWAGIDWPREYGGRGLSLLEQVVWYEELARAGAPRRSVLAAGLNQMGHTLMVSASDEQKAAHLPSILTGDVVWCQGFSEPDAGSDLASLKTRGIVDGDEIVVTGSKTWTTYGPYADYQGVLVRTDPTVPKHKGLTWLICDMRTPGIDVRPIRTIDGEAEFSEVFYDDVRVPIENVVGEINGGWRVALSTLTLERGPAFLDHRLALIREIDELIDLARNKGLLANDAIASQLAEARAGAAAVRAMAYRMISTTSHDTPPGPISTAVSVFYGELRQRVTRLSLEILGAESLEMGVLPERWLNSFAGTIAGGTSDIQRNVIGEKVLGLPR